MARKNKGRIGSSFDRLLKEEGLHEEVTARAVKRVIGRATARGPRTLDEVLASLPKREQQKIKARAKELIAEERTRGRGQTKKTGLGARVRGRGKPAGGRGRSRSL